MMSIPLSSRRMGASRQRIGELMRQGIEHPEVLSLAAGFVDSATLPVASLSALAGRLLADDAAARNALQYDTPHGDLKLRECIRQYVASQDGVSTDMVLPASQFVLTAGANQFLSLVCETLFDPGDICLVAGPTYFVFLGTLHGVQSRALWIDTDKEGMLPSALDTTLERLHRSGELSRVKAVYVVSDHDNPGGTCPSAQRRKDLLDTFLKWRERQPMLWIEDAAYRELNYSDHQEPSFRQLDPTGEAVVYTQTFSKSFSPGLRVGFGCGPRELIDGIIDRKSNEDFGSPHLNQVLLRMAMEGGEFANLVEGLRKSYAIKRDAMLSALESEFASDSGVTWSSPRGGLYVWVTLPDGTITDADGPVWNACVNAHKVMYVPGELCYADEHGPTGSLDKPRNHVRLSFGVLSPEAIREGVRRFAAGTQTVVD